MAGSYGLQAHSHTLPQLHPLPPGRYGVRCYRGPTFEASGYGDEMSGQDGRSFGYTVVPTMQQLKHWAELYVAVGPEGSWSPWRSQVVRWATPSAAFQQLVDSNRARHDGARYYYKAADCGLYDLSYYPEVAQKRLAAVDEEGFAAEIEKTDFEDNADTDQSSAPSSCSCSLSAGEERRATDQQLFSIVCKKFEEALVAACLQDDPELQRGAAVAKARAIVTQEILAWQGQQCIARLHPWTATVVWSRPGAEQQNLAGPSTG
jgi:hypothetical protein